MPGEKGHTGRAGEVPCDEGSGVPEAKRMLGGGPGHTAPLITRHFPCASRVPFLSGHVGLGPPSPSVEEGMAVRPSLLAWRTPWTEEPGGLQSDTTEQLGTRARSVVRPHLY